MNRVDRAIHKMRKTKYKRLRKLFRARDMATKHIPVTVKVSELEREFMPSIVDSYFTSDLALRIIEYCKRKSKRPNPPIPHSIKKVVE